MNHLHNASLAALALASALSFNDALAAQRAFVASTGNDSNTANSCAPTTPCRSFTAAMGVVSDGGEIIALDAAGYGAVTVTKSVSIIANPGFYAGIAANTGAAVTIATTGVTVILRGLALNNTGTATYGVNMTQGSKLDIDNCVISNFSDSPGAGVRVTVDGAEVRVTNSTIRDNYDGLALYGGFTTVERSRFSGNFNGTGGVIVYGGASGVTTTATVTDSTFSGNWYALLACGQTTGSTNQVSVSRSNITNNAFAVGAGCTVASDLAVIDNNLLSGSFINTLYQSNGGVIQTRSNNTVGFGAGNTGTTTGATVY